MVRSPGARRRAFPPPVLRLRPAPRTIAAGGTLRALLGTPAIECLAEMLSLSWSPFDSSRFRRAASTGLAPLGILARVGRTRRPPICADAVAVLLRARSPPRRTSADLGLGVF